MATGERRDDAALAAGLGRWVAGHAGAVPGAALGSGPPEIAGMANETVLVDFGPDNAGMVVRLPPVDPTFPDYDLAPQAAVQNAVAAAGVPAPAPAVVVDDPEWIGCPFVVMPRVAGDIAGPAPVFDPYVTEAAPELQRIMHDGLIDTVVAVHAVPWASAGLEHLLPPAGVHAALERWRAYVEWSSEGDPLPALLEALDWCRAHEPETGEVVLLWGDVRLGNLVFDAARSVTAVLDWDLASLGPPEMDLGWYFGLEWMMASLFGRTVPGFPERAEALARYEQRSGRPVHDLDWHEV